MNLERLMILGLGSALFLSGCADTDFCVAEGSEIATPGGLRPIETLRVGDEVWAVDTKTGERVATRITVVRSSERECLALVLGEGVLVCTPDHPIYVAESESYEPAVNFLLGKAQQVLRVGEHGVRRETVAAVRDDAGVRRVFDLTVESEHHNFIADGVVVHNKSTTGANPDPFGGSSGGAEDTIGEDCPPDRETFAEAPREEAAMSLDPASDGSRLQWFFCAEWCPPPPPEDADFEMSHCEPTEDLGPMDDSTGDGGSTSDAGTTDGGGSTTGEEWSTTDGGESTDGGEGSTTDEGASTTGEGGSTDGGDSTTSGGTEDDVTTIHCFYRKPCV